MSTYDTASDPIVRVAAGEVRKRLAQYYQEPSCESELQITLPVGSYYPAFHPNSVAAAAAVSVDALEGPTSESLIDVPSVSHFEELHEVVPPGQARFNLLRWTSGLAVMIVLALAVRALLAARNPEDRFWAPLLASGHAVLLCVEPEDERQDGNLAIRPNVPIPEKTSMLAVFVVSRISRLLGERHVDSEVRSTNLISYYDLQRTPYILIGR